MLQKLIKGLIEKKIVVKKAPNVQGSVKIHFPDPKIQDIVLTHWDPVDVCQRIGVTSDSIRKSNLEALILAGHLVFHKEKPAPKK